MKTALSPLHERLLGLYPALAAVPSAELAALCAAPGNPVRVSASTLLFDEGSPCQGFPLVLSGAVRVARGSPDGRRLELYRVGPGELCVVSAACLFGQAPLTAHGQATEPTELLLVGPDTFERWCAHDGFRRHVFGVFAQRLTDLMSLAEAVSFRRLDQRLAQTLLQHGPRIAMTHQALADELGTVREIVSRLLARFERAGWVRLGRERIEVVEPAALRTLAEQGSGPGG